MHFKYKIIFVPFLAFFFFISCDANYTVTIKIEGVPFSTVDLVGITGDKTYFVATSTGTNGSYEFSLPQNQAVGVYRIVMGKTKRAQMMNEPPQSIDFIFNKENIRLNTYFKAPKDSLVIIKSRENEAYSSFIKQHDKYQLKLELLHPLVNFYPRDDELYPDVVKKYNNIQKNRRKFIDDFMEDNKDLYAARLAKMYYSPYIEAGISEKERKEIFKRDYFKFLDFTDESLLNSSIYSDKIIQYLMLYTDRSYTRVQQEQEFIKAVDVILPYTNLNSKVYAFVLDYLTRGFEKFQMEEVLNHIAENYVNEGCETDNKDVLAKRLKAFNEMAIGKIAPEIEFSYKNKKSKLIDLDADYTVVLFWASWCPHCKEMLPQIQEIYENKKVDFEILSISFDTSKINWQSYLNEHQFTWINYSELKGWDSKSALDYNVYATPTMFILDRNRKIIAKPRTAYELSRNLNSLE